jgi:hypothetical protein
MQVIIQAGWAVSKANPIIGGPPRGIRNRETLVDQIVSDQIAPAIDRSTRIRDPCVKIT